jgi:hypothetical protein
MENNTKRKKPLSEADKKLLEIYRSWCKPKQDHELLRDLIDKEKTDDVYFQVNAEQIFARNKN